MWFGCYSCLGCCVKGLWKLQRSPCAAELHLTLTSYHGKTWGKRSTGAETICLWCSGSHWTYSLQSALSHICWAAKAGITCATSGNLERDSPICSNKFIVPVCPLLATPTLWLTWINTGSKKGCHYGPHCTSSKPPKKLLLDVTTVAIRCCLLSSVNTLVMVLYPWTPLKPLWTLDPTGVAGPAPGSQGTEHPTDLPIKKPKPK